MSNVDFKTATPSEKTRHHTTEGTFTITPNLDLPVTIGPDTTFLEPSLSLSPVDSLEFSADKQENTDKHLHVNNEKSNGNAAPPKSPGRRVIISSPVFSRDDEKSIVYVDDQIYRHSRNSNTPENLSYIMQKVRSSPYNEHTGERNSNRSESISILQTRAKLRQQAEHYADTLLEIDQEIAYQKQLEEKINKRDGEVGYHNHQQASTQPRFESENGGVFIGEPLPNLENPNLHASPVEQNTFQSPPPLPNTMNMENLVKLQPNSSLLSELHNGVVLSKKVSSKSESRSPSVIGTTKANARIVPALELDALRDSLEDKSVRVRDSLDSSSTFSDEPSANIRSHEDDCTVSTGSSGKKALDFSIGPQKPNPQAKNAKQKLFKESSLPSKNAVKLSGGRSSEVPSDDRTTSTEEQSLALLEDRNNDEEDDDIIDDADDDTGFEANGWFVPENEILNGQQLEQPLPVIGPVSDPVVMPVGPAHLPPVQHYPYSLNRPSFQARPRQFESQIRPPIYAAATIPAHFNQQQHPPPRPQYQINPQFDSNQAHALSLPQLSGHDPQRWGSDSALVDSLELKTGSGFQEKKKDFVELNKAGRSKAAVGYGQILAKRKEEGTHSAPEALRKRKTTRKKRLTYSPPPEKPLNQTLPPLSSSDRETAEQLWGRRAYQLSDQRRGIVGNKGQTERHKTQSHQDLIISPNRTHPNAQPQPRPVQLYPPHSQGAVFAPYEPLRFGGAALSGANAAASNMSTVPQTGLISMNAQLGTLYPTNQQTIFPPGMHPPAYQLNLAEQQQRLQGQYQHQPTQFQQPGHHQHLQQQGQGPLYYSTGHSEVYPVQNPHIVNSNIAPLNPFSGPQTMTYQPPSLFPDNSNSQPSAPVNLLPPFGAQAYPPGYYEPVDGIYEYYQQNQPSQIPTANARQDNIQVVGMESFRSIDYQGPTDISDARIMNQPDAGGSYLGEHLKSKSKPAARRYNIHDYRKLTKEVKLGSLGPDVDSEDFRAKAEKRQRQLEYSKLVAQQAPPPQLGAGSTYRAEEAGAATTFKGHPPVDERKIAAAQKREAAIQYAKNVPRPKQRSATTQPSTTGTNTKQSSKPAAAGASTTRTSDNRDVGTGRLDADGVIRVRREELAHMDPLKLRHELEKQNVALIRMKIESGGGART